MRIPRAVPDAKQPRAIGDGRKVQRTRRGKADNRTRIERDGVKIIRPVPSK